MIALAIVLTIYLTVLQLITNLDSVITNLTYLREEKYDLVVANCTNVGLMPLYSSTGF